MVFMIAFIPLSLPAAWVIDSRGFRVAVGFGVVMMGVFGVLRGLAGSNYTLVLLCTIGIAVAQPFLLNSWTKVPANWFAPGERAHGRRPDHAGQHARRRAPAGALAGPHRRHVHRRDAAGLRRGRGRRAAVASSCSRASGRRRRPGPPGMEERALMLDGLRHALTVKPFLVILGRRLRRHGRLQRRHHLDRATSCSRAGSAPTTPASLGGLMLVAGVIGAVVLSALSDRQGKRVRYLVLCSRWPSPACSAWPSSRPRLLLVAARRARVLPRRRAAHRHAVRRGGHVSRRRRAPPTGWCSSAGRSRWSSSTSCRPLRTDSGSFTVSLVLCAACWRCAAVVVSRLRTRRPEAGAVPRRPTPRGLGGGRGARGAGCAALRPLCRLAAGRLASGLGGSA